MPFISVIIPVKNAAKTIEKCILSALSLDYPAFEVIVVNDGSGDDTARILGQFSQRVRIINFSESRGPSKARNAAVAEAKGDFVAFTDADCMVDKGWLRALLDGFTGPNIAAVGGAQRVPDDETAFGRLAARCLQKLGFFSEYMRKGAKLISVRHNASCNVMYRKNVFSREGGFMEGLWPAEDVELDRRILRKCYTLHFNPGAVVYHYRPDTKSAFLKMMSRYGYGQGYLVKRHGFFRAVQFMPLVLLAVVLFLAAVLSFNFKFCLLTMAILFLISGLYFGPDILFLSLGAVIFWHLGFLEGVARWKK